MSRFVISDTSISQDIVNTPTLVKIKDSIVQDIPELRSDISVLQSNIEEIESSLIAIDSSLSALDESIIVLQNNVTSLGNSIAIIQADISIIQTELNQFPDELKNLTNNEISQLKNIDLNVISNLQWGYLGDMNQSVNSSSDVLFNKLEIGNKGSNVTQTTSITTSVTSNSVSGQITTVSYSSLLSGSDTFTVNCTSCKSNSFVLLSPVSYSGTGGNPTYFISSTNNNSFNITIRNFNTLAALNGFHVIKYIIF